jgi:hypothetical protein
VCFAASQQEEGLKILARVWREQKKTRGLREEEIHDLSYCTYTAYYPKKEREHEKYLCVV